jgi:hypothetical protein
MGEEGKAVGFRLDSEQAFVQDRHLGPAEARKREDQKGGQAESQIRGCFHVRQGRVMEDPRWVCAQVPQWVHRKLQWPTPPGDECRLS